MKNIRHIFLSIALVLLLTNGLPVAYAMDIERSTEVLSEEDRYALVKNINVSMFEIEPEKRAIECFDVSEEGFIAVGSGDSEEKTICVYTKEGVFQRGYRFNCSGDFGVELDRDTPIIYLVRSNVVITVNSQGEIEKAEKVKDSSENTAYWNRAVFSTTQKVGETEYSIRNNMGILNILTSSYAQLIAVDEGGEERILYDVSSNQTSKTVLFLIVATFFVCIVMAVVVRQFVKLKRNI